jgi:hypothetical protein
MADLNEYEVVFYNKRSGFETERVSGIRAMNPVEAERIAWQVFDDRHKLEKFTSREMYRTSVKGPGQ